MFDVRPEVGGVSCSRGVGGRWPRVGGSSRRDTRTTVTVEWSRIESTQTQSAIGRVTARMDEARGRAMFSFNEHTVEVG